MTRNILWIVVFLVFMGIVVTVIEGFGVVLPPVLFLVAVFVVFGVVRHNRERSAQEKQAQLENDLMDRTRRSPERGDPSIPATEQPDYRQPW